MAPVIVYCAVATRTDPRRQAFPGRSSPANAQPSSPLSSHVVEDDRILAETLAGRHVPCNREALVIQGQICRDMQDRMLPIGNSVPRSVAIASGLLHPESIAEIRQDHCFWLAVQAIGQPVHVDGFDSRSCIPTAIAIP
jgi:hypothetical protein